MEKQLKDDMFPPALERAIDILVFLTESPDASFSAKEISVRLGIPYTSAYRILKCMDHYGLLTTSFLDKDRYKLGYRLITIGKAALGHTDYVTVAAPYLAGLSEASKQSCLLSMLTGTGVATLDQTLPDEGLIMISKLGFTGDPYPQGV